jgi:hypothetical protein
MGDKRLDITFAAVELLTSPRCCTDRHRYQLNSFIAKLAALVPKPRVNLTRFHGVFATNSKHPSPGNAGEAPPTKRGRGRKRHQPTGDNWPDKTPAERHASMTWMQRLKRVFNWAASGSILRPASAVRGRLGSAWPQDQLPAAGLDGSGTQPRGRGLALPVGGNDLGADTGDASGESSLSQRHIDQAVIQQALNAILGSDHPASVRFATMIREIEAEMDAHDPLPVPERFESIVRLCLRRDAVTAEAGRAGDEDHWRRAWDRYRRRLLTGAPSNT